MPATALIETRIDTAVKDEAAAVLASLGLTVSDAMCLMLTRVAQEHALSFDPLIPNAETVAAMLEARRGGLASFDSIRALFNDLHADA
jgi:DNA-damage-inducible protein J